MAEAAELASVNRSTVLRWCEASGVDPHEARREYIHGQWRKEQDRGQGRIKRKPSKRELRQAADRAAKDWTNAKA